MQSNTTYSGTLSSFDSFSELSATVFCRPRALAEEDKKRGLFLWPPALPAISTIRRQTDIQLTRQLNNIDRSLVTLLCCTEK